MSVFSGRFIYTKQLIHARRGQAGWMRADQNNCHTNATTNQSSCKPKKWSPKIQHRERERAFSPISWMFASCLPRTYLTALPCTPCTMHSTVCKELWWAHKSLVSDPRCCLGNDMCFLVYSSCLQMAHDIDIHHGSDQDVFYLYWFSKDICWQCASIRKQENLQGIISGVLGLLVAATASASWPRTRTYHSLKQRLSQSLFRRKPGMGLLPTCFAQIVCAQFVKTGVDGLHTCCILFLWSWHNGASCESRISPVHSWQTKANWAGQKPDSKSAQANWSLWISNSRNEKGLPKPWIALNIPPFDIRLESWHILTLLTFVRETWTCCI